MIIVTSSFSKCSVFQNVFCPHENETPPFPNSSGLKSVLEKFRLCDGLVWTVGLTVELKLRFLPRCVADASVCREMAR